VLAIKNIQGNIIAGFNKDFQAFLFLKITDVQDFKRWLKSVIPFVATASEVIAFNRLFKEIRKRRGVESRTVQATWLNIAFSFHALKQLTEDANAFTDEAFKDGLAARSQNLGDPTDPDAEGHPSNWVVGGPENEADVMLLVASDDRNDLFAEVARIEDTIYAARTPDGKPTHSGVQVIYKQNGATLPPPLTGHEHFGFLDGVSQPGLRGLLSDDPNDVLTLRQNPKDRDQGKPGQDLLWPGEFVFGYPGQDPTKKVSEKGPVSNAGPAWGKDGSFLVFRRLRQDVFTFHNFLRDTAKDLGINSGLFGAKCVGRWASGAPILRAPNKDNKALANSDCANNNFEFQDESEQIRPEDKESPIDCTDENPNPPPNLFAPSPGDPKGERCPFAGHIRKTYPRDDTSKSIPSLGEESTQTHRLLRRGIPYGEASLSKPTAPVEDSVDRGLLFLAYQTSIEQQFEFVTKAWVNNPNFKDPDAGHDPIIGQNNTAGENRERKFKVTFKKDGSQCTEEVSTQDDWVIPTGGGYFFAPSISALELLSLVTPEEYAAAIEENIPDRG
jgi:Dyp-type peroxidase family